MDSTVIRMKWLKIFTITDNSHILMIIKLNKVANYPSIPVQHNK